jgi:hypothetical protein
MQDSLLTTLLPLTLSVLAAAWAMLSLLGSERERRMREQQTTRPTSLLPTPPPSDIAPVQRSAAATPNARPPQKNKQDLPQRPA